MIAINEYIINKQNISKTNEINKKHLLDVLDKDINIFKLRKLLEKLSYTKYHQENVDYESRRYIANLFNADKYTKQYMIGHNDGNAKFIFIYNPEKSKSEFISFCFSANASFYSLYFCGNDESQAKIEFDFVKDYLS